MRIVIEIEGELQQPQVTVTPASGTQQPPGAAQPPAGDVTNAGPAPTGVGQATEGAVNQDVTAPIVAQPDGHSAGAAPNVSAE